MDYFKLVRNKDHGCVNYVEKGPYQKPNYCLMCTDWENYTCLIKQGLDCDYFVAAVLPTDRTMQNQWRADHRVKNQPAPVIAKKKPGKGSLFGGGLCACGEEYERKTIRQKRCEKCIKESNRLSASARQRKHSQ